MTAAAHVVRLGPDVAAGETPQAIVPVHAWQAAETTGDWTLVGCTVAPGFEFAGFEMAPPDWSACTATPSALPEQHVFRRDQAAAGDQQRGDRHIRGGLAKPARIRKPVDSSGVA